MLKYCNVNINKLFDNILQTNVNMPDMNAYINVLKVYCNLNAIDNTLT